MSEPKSIEPATEWPNCATPDCPNKRCLWSGTPLCYPCAEHALSKEAMRAQWFKYNDAPPEGGFSYERGKL
jgi:hypothetical protein